MYFQLVKGGGKRSIIVIKKETYAGTFVKGGEKRETSPRGGLLLALPEEKGSPDSNRGGGRGDNELARGLELAAEKAPKCSPKNGNPTKTKGKKGRGKNPGHIPVLLKGGFVMTTNKPGEEGKKKKKGQGGERGEKTFGCATTFYAR